MSLMISSTKPVAQDPILSELADILKHGYQPSIKLIAYERCLGHVAFYSSSYLFRNSPFPHTTLNMVWLRPNGISPEHQREAMRPRLVALFPITATQGLVQRRIHNPGKTTVP